MARQMKRNADPAANAELTLHNALNATSDPVETRVLQHYLENTDFTEYRKLQDKHLSLRSTPAKFLDLTTWLQARVEVIRTLGLEDATQPRRILDIGCGPCHFGLGCRVFGHEVLGLDLPDNAIYNDLVTFWDLERVAEPIRAMEPIPVPEDGGFDVVTALSANFYQKPDGTLFTEDDWRAFFSDLAQHLAVGGVVYFKLNPLSDHQGLHAPDLQYVRLIESLGGTISDTTVSFAKDALSASA